MHFADTGNLIVPNKELSWVPIYRHNARKPMQPTENILDYDVCLQIEILR